MLTVGITGGIGSGKTTVCKIFEILGVPVYYADEKAKEILCNNQEVVEKVKKLLGNEAYINGKLNRDYIASKVFHDKDLLERYNAIIHPAVAEDTWKWSQQHAHFPYVLKEAALMVETGSYRFLDKLIVVTAPLHIRIDRVMQRDHQSRDAVEARIKNQLSDEEKMKVANYVIVNDHTRSIIKQVLNIHHELLALAKALKSQTGRF
jgi:dephospho-CoA kinase